MDGRIGERGVVGEPVGPASLGFTSWQYDPPKPEKKQHTQNTEGLKSIYLGGQVGMRAQGSESDTSEPETISSYDLKLGSPRSGQVQVSGRGWGAHLDLKRGGWGLQYWHSPKPMRIVKEAIVLQT